MKECRSCGVEREEAFYRKGRNKCKVCLAAEAKQRYHANKTIRKDQNLRRLYGISLEEYNTMFAEQEGCCAICGTHQMQLKRALAVDHDHDTGKVRALLCTHCNTALGSFFENEETILRALDYLKSTSV